MVIIYQEQKIIKHATRIHASNNNKKINERRKKRRNRIPLS